MSADTLTRQDSIHFYPSEDIRAGIGQIQLYETDKEDIQMASSDPIVAATPMSHKEIASASQGSRRKGTKTND